MKLLSEKSLMNVVLFEITWKLRYLGHVPLSRTLNGIIVVVALCVQLYLNVTRAKSAVWHYVYCLLSFTWCLMLGAFIQADLTGKKNTRAVYDTILSIDDAVKSTLAHQNDWFLLLIVVSFPHLACAMIALLYVSGMLAPLILFGSSTVLVLYEVIWVSIVRHAIVKRLKYIRSGEFNFNRVKETVFYTRRILECNTRLNHAYGPLETSFLVYTFQLLLYFCYTMWGIYGAKENLPTIYEYHLYPSVICYGSILLVAVLTSTVSSYVANEADEIMTELDVSYTARDLNEEETRLVYILIMELYHTPVQLTVLGLFNVSRATITSACAVAISYLLVLIQYT